MHPQGPGALRACPAEGRFNPDGTPLLSRCRSLCMRYFRIPLPLSGHTHFAYHFGEWKKGATAESGRRAHVPDKVSRLGNIRPADLVVIQIPPHKQVRLVECKTQDDIVQCVRVVGYRNQARMCRVRIIEPINLPVHSCCPCVHDSAFMSHRRSRWGFVVRP